MSCNYYRGKCLFLNGKEDGCNGCPIKKAYNKGVRDTKKDYERPTDKWLASVIEELESRKSYGVEYAQAMEDVIAILTAKLRADTEERG